MGPAISRSDHLSNTAITSTWDGGWTLHSKVSAAALLRIFTALMSCVIFVMIWERARSNSSFFADSAVRDQFFKVQIGDNGRASALWNSAEPSHASGERLSKADTAHISGSESDITSADLELGCDLEAFSRGRSLDSEGQIPSGERTSATNDAGSTALLIADRTMKYGVADTDELADSEPARDKISTPGTAMDGSDDAVPADVATREDRTDGELGRGSVGQLVNAKRCDFSKGEWVDDNDRYYYSGKDCTAFMDREFACRLRNRPSFEYEKFRWQPEGCDLPRFSSDEFLERMRNKVVAFIGDSLGRQQFQSLMCMLTAGLPDDRVRDVHKAWGEEVKWAWRFKPTNTSIVFYWSAPICDVEEGRHDEKRGHAAVHLDRPPAWLQEHFHQLHVLVLNTGHHWNRGKWEGNKWHPYVNGQPNRDRKLVEMAALMNFTVHKTVEWINTQLATMERNNNELPAERRSDKPMVFVRTLSPRHFENGEYNTGGTCDNTKFEPKEAVQAPPARRYRGPITAKIAEIAVKGTRLNLLNITHLSKSRKEGHVSMYGVKTNSLHQDCLHWCLPGIPDVWNEVLYGELVTLSSFGPL